MKIKSKLNPQKLTTCKTLNQKEFSIVAVRNFAPDDTIVALTGKITDHPTATSIQIGHKNHLENCVIRHINHSCDPNSYINCEDLTMKALSEIRQGEELTINYNSTEAALVHPFFCACKSKACIKSIRGFKFLSKEERRCVTRIARHLLRRV